MEINSNTESVFAEVNRTQKFDGECLKNTVFNRNFNTVYYGIYIPSDGQHKTTGSVFTDKTEVLNVVKRNKKARFKSFHYYHEAVEFATHGADLNNSLVLNDDSHKKQDQAVSVTEKLQFRGPKLQDLVKLRKAIEAGDVTSVETAIWENPRYLISSGDTPSILHEGVRYNALHVAAKAKSSEMCELILNTIGNLEFIELLYGDDHQNSEERARVLLDLYLNTPDKGLNETPLHLAVKFGATKVVEVLVSFPQCDKFIKNKYGKLPSQIIADRCDVGSSEKIKSDIALLLEENYYVPVLRSEDNCNLPIIGEPFSPSSPPTYNAANPVDGRVEIHAYAGPMNKKGAESFRKIWKTPPCFSNSDYHFKTVKSPPGMFTGDVTLLKLKDHEKGLEAVGRELSAKYDVNWKEYWPFLANFINLASDEGLQQLEKYLKAKSGSEFDEKCSSPILLHSVKETQDVSDVIENALCKAFQTLNLSSNGVAKSKSLFSEYFDDDVSPIKSDLCPVFCVEKACQVFAHRIAIDILHFKHNENSIVKALEMQIKCLEQLMFSYLDDDRFRDIRLHSVHARLGSLIVHKILDCWDEYKLSDSCDESSSVKNLMEEVQSHCVNYFKDNNQTCIILKNASINKKLLCVLDFVLRELSKEATTLYKSDCEEDYKETWRQCAECTCTWQKDKRKAYGSKRHTQKLRGPGKCPNSVSKRLFAEEDDDEEDLDPEKYVTSLNLSDSTSSSQNESDCSSSEDEYFTPPSSLSMYCSDEEQYCDSLLPQYDLFIEGKEPTKTDHNVFMALKYVGNKLNPKEYPYVYKWHHMVSLHSEEERRRWPIPKNQRKHASNVSKTVSSAFHNASFGDEENQVGAAHSSSKSWFRITGAYSPRTSLRIRHNVSYNL